MTDSSHYPESPRPIRWWPGALALLLATIAIVWVRSQADWAFQKRNLVTAQVAVSAVILFLIWWTFLSRAGNRLRLRVTFGLIGLAAISAALFRIQGVSGDLIPIIEFRWKTGASLTATNVPRSELPTAKSGEYDFPQFYGPYRNGILAGPKLETNWSTYPPQVLWRQVVGPARSGFAVVGGLTVTQEQRGEEECVVAYELNTGRQVWLHADPAHYDTTIAGNGPQATPTVISNRVITMGGTGILNCLNLDTGQAIWSKNVVTESGGTVPQWGAASSPLVWNNQILVHGGEKTRPSVYAFSLEDGKRLWSGGNAEPSYASLSVATLAGIPQVLAFNHRNISSLDPLTGRTLWEKTWGNGNVVCAQPVAVASNQVLFSSGYGVGSELLEISETDSGTLSYRLLWKSVRMKAKFAHLFAHDGFLYGLDDGIFACVDLKDGSQRWKEGRYGHGQGLLVGDVYLLVAESGELVLLQPTPAAPNELARFPVFRAKTWNPPALAGNLLLLRNEQEAACLRLRLVPEQRTTAGL